MSWNTTFALPAALTLTLAALTLSPLTANAQEHDLQTLRQNYANGHFELQAVAGEAFALINHCCVTHDQAAPCAVQFTPTVVG